MNLKEFSKNKIEHYSFGRIIIEGKEYTKDVLIFPDKVKSPWWRKEGHNLSLEDIKEVLQFFPEILVIGTGAYACMNVEDELKKILKEKNIEFFIRKTEEACKLFNTLYIQNKKVVALLHLTC